MKFEIDFNREVDDKVLEELGALLCSKCSVIIKIGKDFTKKEHAALKGEVKLKAQYCNNCKDENRN